jgi:hypothetical protein
MSTVKEKSKPLPHDPEMEAQEQTRLETLSANPAYITGVMRAQAQELANRRREYEGAVSDLRRIEANAGSGNFAANRAGYLRVNRKIESLGQLLADETGETFSAPPFNPPGESQVSNDELAARIDRLAQVLAELTGKNVLAPSEPRSFRPRNKSTAELVTRPDGSKVTVDMAGAYTERAGKGPSGRGTAGIPIPGSAADHDWLSLDGAAK